MKKIKFSVIICAYNVENYVEECINSVLNQTYKNFEVIVVNDASTDRTLLKLKNYKQLKIINNKKNEGLGKCRNIACRKAAGEYILYLDADDTLYENTSLEKINETIKDAPDIAYFGVKYIGGSNKVYLPNAENSTKEARITCDMHFAVSSKCWKRKFLEDNNIKFIENMYYEDMVYSIKATILANKITYGEFPIYNYIRNRQGSIMSTPNLKRCSDMYVMLSELMKLYEMTPEKYKPYLLTFIKKETESLPKKVCCILKSMKNNTNNPVFEKRNYQYDATDEEVNI